MVGEDGAGSQRRGVSTSERRKSLKYWRLYLKLATDSVDRFLQKCDEREDGENVVLLSSLALYVQFALDVIDVPRGVDEVGLKEELNGLTIEELENRVNAVYAPSKPWLCPDPDDFNEDVREEDCLEIMIAYQALWRDRLEGPSMSDGIFSFRQKDLDALARLTGDELVFTAKRRNFPSPDVRAKEENGMRRTTLVSSRVPFSRKEEESFKSSSMRLLKKALRDCENTLDKYGSPSGWSLHYVEDPTRPAELARTLNVVCEICGSALKVQPQTNRNPGKAPSPNVATAKRHLLKCIEGLGANRNMLKSDASK